MTDQVRHRSEWSVSFVANGITPYLRSSVEAGSDRTVTVGRWSTILGVIPITWKRETVPFGDVTGARIGRALHPDRLLAAAALGTAALLSGDHRTLRVVTTVAAVLMIPLSVVAVLRVERRNGRHVDAPICLLMIPRARRAAETLGSLIGVAGAGPVRSGAGSP